MRQTDKATLVKIMRTLIQNVCKDADYLFVFLVFHKVSHLNNNQVIGKTIDNPQKKTIMAPFVVMDKKLLHNFKDTVISIPKYIEKDSMQLLR